MKNLVKQHRMHITIVLLAIAGFFIGGIEATLIYLGLVGFHQIISSPGSIT